MNAVMGLLRSAGLAERTGISDRFFLARAAQIGPVDIGSQIFTSHHTARLSFDIDCERLSARLRPVSHVPQVSIGRLTLFGELVPGCDWQRGKVGFQVHAQEITPDGVINATPFVEFRASLPDGVIAPMNVDAEIRRENLRRIVERDGLAVASRKFGKPDRQINDMLAGRKSFGEKVAHQMEAHYAPDLPKGWLSQPSAHDQIAQYIVRKPVNQKSEREKRLDRINDALAVTDDTGLAVVLDKAEEMARKYPVRKANAS